MNLNGHKEGQSNERERQGERVAHIRVDENTWLRGETLEELEHLLLIDMQNPGKYEFATKSVSIVDRTLTIRVVQSWAHTGMTLRPYYEPDVVIPIRNVCTLAAHGEFLIHRGDLVSRRQLR